MIKRLSKRYLKRGGTYLSYCPNSCHSITRWSTRLVLGFCFRWHPDHHYCFFCVYHSESCLLILHVGCARQNSLPLIQILCFSNMICIYIYREMENGLNIISNNTLIAQFWCSSVQNKATCQEIKKHLVGHRWLWTDE